MKKYEARLNVGQWSENGWVFMHDVVNVWEVEEKDLEMWMNDVKNENVDLFDYVTDAFREWNEKPDYDKIDNEWTMTLVEISDGGAEKILGMCSVWESDLAEKWFN